MEKISIIVPMYNSEKTIQRCLDSIILQNYPNIEILVIDDGSSDKSAEIIKSYLKGKVNIKYFYQRNKGVSAARNLGINRSTGAYVMFVDSDDYIEPNTCSIAMSKFSEEIDLVIFGLNVCKNGKLLRNPHLEDRIIELRKDIDEYWYLRKINLGPCNKIYKKILIKQLFDETLSLGEDTKFVLDYMRNVNYIFSCSECLYNVSLDNSNSLNRKYNECRLDMLLKIRREEFVFLRDLYPSSKDARIYEEYFYNLHAVLVDIFMNNNELNKKDLLRKNIDKYDFTYIYKQVYFNKLYYRIFSFLVVKKYFLLLYLLLKLRSQLQTMLNTRQR